MAFFDFLKKKKKIKGSKKGDILKVRDPEKKEIKTGLRKEGTKKPEVIKLQEKEKTGIAEFREREGVVANLVKAATDWRTTVALLATLGTLGAGAAVIGGAGTATAGTAVITRTATQIRLGGLSMTTQRAFTGRAVTSGINKIFHAIRPVAARFATNPKSMALTTKLLIGGGMTIGAAGATLTILGTYPFAGFIKEEAIQATNFPIQAALDAGDLEGAQMLLDQSNEIINMNTSQIPIKNVLDNLNAYFKSQATANIEWQRLIDERLKEAEGVGEFESPFEKAAREREERDIETQKDIEESRQESEEIFQRRQKEIEEGVAARDEAERIKFEEIAREREEQDRLNTMFYEAIRKRNEGIELTDEEKELLISRGVDPEPIKSTTTFRRRSRVQF